MRIFPFGTDANDRSSVSIRDTTDALRFVVSPRHAPVFARRDDVRERAASKHRNIPPRRLADVETALFTAEPISGSEQRQPSDSFALDFPSASSSAMLIVPTNGFIAPSAEADYWASSRFPARKRANETREALNLDPAF